MAADKQALRQQIIAQLERCEAIAYAAGHHFAEHGKHAPSRTMQQADADATLVRLIEEYAAVEVAAPVAYRINTMEGHAVAPHWVYAEVLPEQWKGGKFTVEALSTRGVDLLDGAQQ